MATLRERLDEDLKQAMRNRNEQRLSVLRLVRTAIRNTELAMAKELLDERLEEMQQRTGEDAENLLDKIVQAKEQPEVTLDDEGIRAVLNREVKQRRDSVEAFRKAGRDDLVAKEEAELAILLEYQPEQLSREQVAALVRETMAQTGAAGAKDKGKVMSALMPQVRGKADGRMVNEVVTELLG